jgi:hypothetical protein
MGWPKNIRRKNTSPKKHMLKLLASSSMTSPEMRQMNCKILRKKGTEKILQEEEEEKNKLKITIEKLIRIREENAKLKQLIASMENEQRNFTTRATVYQNQTHLTHFTVLDENMGVDDPTIIKRTRNVLSDSSLSGTAQLKTKKGNAEEETNSENEVSNLTLDGFRITGSNSKN